MKPLCAAFLICLAGGVGQAQVSQSLDEALKADNAGYQEASPATKQLWETVLTSLEKNEYDKAPALIQQFQGTTDFVEPYQKEFCSLSIQLLGTTNPAAQSSPAPNPQQAAIDTAQEEIKTLRIQLSTKEADHTALEKKLQKAQSNQAVLGMFIRVNGQPISTSGSAQSQLADNEHEINELKQKISSQETRLTQLSEAGSRQLAQEAANASQADAHLRQEVLNFLTQQKDAANYRVVVALANIWEAKRGQDPDINKLAQDTIDLQKIEVKAHQIASLALKPATDLIAAGKLWSAAAEIERAEQLIANQITDPLQLKLIQKELFSTTNDVKHSIDLALKKRETVFGIAQRDAIEGGKEFDDFSKQYPDYPDRDQDMLKISDLKTQQVEAKYAQKIAAIEEVIPDDPEEAKSMINRLFESGIGADEISILKSRIVKLKRQILEKEIVLVTNDLDEAQSYLTRVSSTYAAELKQGGKPNLSFMESVSSGTENLVRARSLQAGSVKRLEMLLNEDTDNVTKSRLVGLLETQKAALSQIDETITSQKDDKIVVLAGCGIATCLVIGGLVFGFLLLKRKKTILA